MGKFCGENAVVVSDGQRLCIWDMESEREYVFPLQAENSREIAVRREAGAYQLALLAEGRLILARCQSGAELQKREHSLTLAGIHHVAIVRENHIVLGSFGGTVSLVPVKWDTLKALSYTHLTLPTT